MVSSSLDITVILLAGGQGSRMGASMPKQYLKLHGKEVALYSFEVFLAHPEVGEIVVVCEKEYEPLFKREGKNIRFAPPGSRRQDSVYNGLQAIESGKYIAVHDSARPCVETDRLSALFAMARECNAATLASRATSTLKIVNDEGWIVKPLDRNEVWEIQTPQVVEKELLEQAFEVALRENYTVTDETSLVALIDQPVRVLESPASNIKLTRPADLQIAQALLMGRVT